MADMQMRLIVLRREAADLRRISDRATDMKKRELFARLADHMCVLADDVARLIGNGMPQKTN